jgi:methyltransferase (TIGR00027 family)
MKSGRASRTAELVCMGRAVAHEAIPGVAFRDPTAFALLPDGARERVVRVRSGTPPKGLRQHVEQGYLRRQSAMMAVRTLAIDDAVRGANTEQVVILGAGLDGRAWRMPELCDTVVFEVDHPDSQRDKRARIGPLARTAREVRFVPVDFERDALDDALQKAGHDPSLSTVWVWEGVVMYLAEADIEATLAVIDRRSAPRSRLVIAYHAPAPILAIVGFLVGLLGEPLRSAFTPAAMQRLLAKFRFRVVSDEDVHTIGTRLSPDIGRVTKLVRHLRVVMAERDG